LRDFSERIKHCGDFYGQSRKGEPCPDPISTSGLIRFLASLAPGITELGCHPGLGNDFDSVYLAERTTEVATLCQGSVREMINRNQIALVSFEETEVA